MNNLANKEKATVLIVDDTPLNIDVLCGVLKEKYAESFTHQTTQ